MGGWSIALAIYLAQAMVMLGARTLAFHAWLWTVVYFPLAARGNDRVKRRTGESDSHELSPVFRGPLPLIGILLVAIALRIYRLDEAPSGLLYDEAYNGLDVVRILNGARPVFLAENFGREALFIYLQAVSVAALGPTDFALRSVAALIGILTVPASFLLIRRLFNRPVALLTCAWLSVSLWHVLFSRIGLRTILLPLVIALSFWCLWRGLDATWGQLHNPPSGGGRRHFLPRLAWFALAGAGIGLSLYTYSSSRFVPVVVAVFALYLAVFHRSRFRQALPGLVVAGMIALVVFAPEGYYFLRHPSDFVQRASEVSIFNPQLNDGNPTLALASSILRTGGMFVWRGDAHWDRNLPGRAVFDPVSSVLLVLGAVVLISKWREPRIAFTIGWLAIMLLPSVLTVKDVPNYLRVTGTIPAVFCLPAVGAMWIQSRWAASRFNTNAQLPVVIACLSFLTGAALTYHDYFRVWAIAATVRSEFNTDRWTTLEAAKRLVGSKQSWLYVGDGDPGGPMQTFALYRFPFSQSLRLFNGARTLPLPPAGLPATYLFADSDHPPAILLDRYLSGDQRPVIVRTANGVEVPTYDLVAPAAGSGPSHPLAARFGDALEVTGFDVPTDVSAGQTITIRWYWRVLRPDDRNLTMFNQLFDEAGVRRGQLDDRPFVPNYWPSGSIGVTWFDIPLGSELQTGPLTPNVGVYDIKTMARLPIFDANGQSSGDHIILPPIKVHGIPTEMPTIGNRKLVHFSDQIDLVGYAIVPTEPKPGAPVTLTLDWGARGRPSRDYTVFVHLLDDKDGIVAQGDAPPRAGRYPSSLWDVGEVIEDPHSILAPTAPPLGHYRFAIGLYNPATGQRLATLDDDAKAVSDTVVLNWVASP